MKSALEKILSSIPVDQWQTESLILLDWHDGPIEGVCLLERPTCAFYFQCIGEWHNPEGLDDRIFQVSDFPGITAAQVTELCVYGTQASPSKTLRVDPAFRRIEAILAMRGKPTLVVRTSDMKRFTAVWAVASSVTPNLPGT